MKYVARGMPAKEAERDALAFWRTLPSPPSDNTFRWGYLGNPLAPAQCFLLDAVGGPPPDDTSSHVVGLVGVGARRVILGHEDLSAALLGGFYVDKSHRTFFPALTLQRAAITWSRRNCDFVYGFPNESSAPIMKKLGFRDLAVLSRYVLVLRHSRYLERVLRSSPLARIVAAPVDGFRRFVRPGISRSAPRGLVFRRFDVLDDRFDAMFRARAFKDYSVGHRDAKLLAWRFLARPDEAAAVYGLESKDEGTLHAYAVVHLAADVAHVRDLQGRDAASMGIMLRLLAGELRGQRAVVMSFLCAAPPELAAELFALGFRVRPPSRTMIGLAGDRIANDASKAGVLASLDRWYATEADEDQ